MGKRHTKPAPTVTQRFEMFLEQAGRLEDRRWVQSGMSTSVAITVGGEAATVAWARPDEEEFHAFLVDMWPFISDAEPVFLNRMYSLIEQHVTDPELREEARQSRMRLGHAAVGKDLRLKDRSPAQIADAYIDGTFHVDPAARERSARPAGFLADLDLWFVQSYCASVTKRVAEVASVVRRAVASGDLSDTLVATEGS